MFENLKAFIRHGKQANELKRKEDPTFSTKFDGDGLVDISNLPSLAVDADGVQIRDVRMRTVSEADLTSATATLTDTNPKETKDYSHVASQVL